MPLSFYHISHGMIMDLSIFGRLYDTAKQKQNPPGSVRDREGICSGYIVGESGAPGVRSTIECGAPGD